LFPLLLYVTIAYPSFPGLV